ncbi:hypothetical protein [Streptomyces uncialis]|uniref:hypothetical protein n=1 Tax=Streptomyces uncialis TaxID=1048205 RepID=UPI0033C273C1
MRDTTRWASAAGAGMMALGALVGLSSVSGGGVGDDGSRTPRHVGTTVDEAERREAPVNRRSGRTLPAEFGTTTGARSAATTDG